MRPSQILRIILAFLIFGGLIAAAVICYRISYGLPII